MFKILKKIYLNSPMFIKKIFANLEALRRNSYRRGRYYRDAYKEINIKEVLSRYDRDKQLQLLNRLLDKLTENIPYYQKFRSKIGLNSVKDIEKFPVLDKSIMKKNIRQFINPPRESLWQSKTSGSTGTPFSYYRDKGSIQYEYALHDRLHEFVLGEKNNTIARISGVEIKRPEEMKAPFWYYIAVFDQLQCSAYHIN